MPKFFEFEYEENLKFSIESIKLIISVDIENYLEIIKLSHLRCSKSKRTKPAARRSAIK